MAAAALLVHAAAIDGEVLPAEHDKLRALIKQAFDLDDAKTDELLEKATAAEHEAARAKLAAEDAEREEKAALRQAAAEAEAGADDLHDHDHDHIDDDDEEDEA